MTNNHTTSTLSAILQQVSSDLEKESQIKESIKESLQPLDTLSRNVTALINRSHSTPEDKLDELANEVLSQVKQGSGQWALVADRIPTGEYHKYQYQPSFILKSLTTSIALAHFLLTASLIPLAEVIEIIGIKQEWQDRVMLSTDDYLQGVIGASNELARLAMNSVTLGNFSLPLKIASFEKDLFAGFSLVRSSTLSAVFRSIPLILPDFLHAPLDQLNLRNDTLRRRFDSLKYDVKRCEDVVYDITLRGLVGKGKEASSS